MDINCLLVQLAERLALNQEVGGSIPSQASDNIIEIIQKFIPPSSSGRTSDFESANGRSNRPGGSIFIMRVWHENSKVVD